MKTQHIVIGAALAVAVGSGAAAQQSSSTPSDRDHRQGRSTVTLTGCLQEGGAPAGAASSTSRSSGGDRFVLANATMGGGARSDSPVTGHGAGAAGGSTYMLAGKTNDLRKHVNQQIEVTGRLESASGGSASGSSTGAASSDRDTTRHSDKTSADDTRASSAGAHDTGQRVQVESVRPISSSCSR